MLAAPPTILPVDYSMCNNYYRIPDKGENASKGNPVEKTFSCRAEVIFIMLATRSGLGSLFLRQWLSSWSFWLCGRSHAGLLGSSHNAVGSESNQEKHQQNGWTCEVSSY